MADKRFDVIYTQGTITSIEILRDRETGVNYLHTVGGLTPLLDKDGKPIRTTDSNAGLSKYGDAEFDNAEPDGTKIDSEENKKAEIGSAEFDRINSQFAFVTKPEPPKTVTSENAQPTASGEKIQGFGIALASLLASICSYIVLYFYNWSAFLLFPIVVVAALVLGIKSIQIFRECGRENRPRPVSTLVLGIVGLANCSVAGLVWLILIATYNAP